ncbi:retrovirus-related pol polyprotein from transposon TNT 1-94 [Tanacetum coccineum]
MKTSIEEPPTDLELKPLPDNLECVFLEEPSFLPVIISSQLSEENKNKLISILKRHKQAFAWKTTDIPGICPSFCKHKIQLLEDKKSVVQKQRSLNPNMQKVVKKEIVKLLDTGIIFLIADSPWVSPIQYVPKKGSITVATNERNELVATRTVTGCKDSHLVLNWEKCHFMVKEGIVLGHKVSEAGLEVDKEKINVISKLPPPTNIKGSNLGTLPIWFLPSELSSLFQRVTSSELQELCPFFLASELSSLFHNSYDIQAASFDTRPPMLDRTDYDSWSQRIRLYCRGKENGIYILQSIDHERHRTYDDLNDNDKKRFDADVCETNIVLQGLPKDIYKLINHNIKEKAIWDNVKMLLARSELTKEDRESQLYDKFERFKMLPGENINEYYVRFHKLVNDIRNIRMTMPNIQLNSKFVNNMSPEWDRFVTAVKLNKRLKETHHEQLYAYLKQHEKHANQNQRNFARGAGAAGNGGAQNRAGNANVGQGKLIKCYNCNGLGHMAWNCTQPKHPQNSDFFKDKMLLMQAQENGVVLDEEELLFLAAGPSNASILSEVHDLENTIDHCDDNQDEHETHNEVQQKHVIDSNGADMGNSNVIPYEQYLTINEVSVEPSCASFVPNDAYVLHDNNAYIPHDPLKMDEQMSILIQDRNKKEENLKKELHSVKLQLNSTIKSNKIIEETVTALKHEFKQKETKFLTDFSNLKKLNDKLKNKLYSQDHSIQTVHMMLKPKKLYDQDAVTAIGAQNPFYLRKAKMVQPALYDGDEILKTHHVPVSVTSSEEDLEIAEITRQKMNDPVCVEKKIKIIPPNYSKENFLATFTPQTQLTPEQVFWSKDLLKQRAEDLKTNAPPLPILPPATVYPPNTPVHLVPRTLPTTSQVNIGERGFEQTKRCYLTEVIPFFNLLKEHFDEVQRSLVKEVRAMKAVFENMEAEVDQNVIDKKCGEIERKNLLITNENLIANSENSKLLEKIQNDDHDTMIKDFSKLEIAHLNLQLKHQHLKENIENFKSKSSKDVPEFDAFFELGKRDDQIQGHKNTIPLQEQLEHFKAKNEKVKQHYQELFNYIKIMLVKTIERTTSLQTKIENLKTQFKGKMPCVTSNVESPKVSVFEKYAIEIESIPLIQRNNRDVHHHYLNRLRDTLDTLHEIVEEARCKQPSDHSLDYACVYTKRSQELLENDPRVIRKYSLEDGEILLRSNIKQSLETSDDSEVEDNFPGETLMEINTEDEPWFADLTNYLASDIITKGMTYQQKNFFLRHQTLLLEGTLPLQVCSDAYKTPTGTTLYKLIYGKNCHLPFEIEHRAYCALKNYNPDLISTGEK